MIPLVGREEEVHILQDALQSSSPELIAVYGRRRIGKTFLIRTVFEKHICFETTGLRDSAMASQLDNFCFQITQMQSQRLPVKTAESWLRAFQMLQVALEQKLKKKKKKQVVFFDEMPWMDTPRSGFLAAFEGFWNSWASKRDDLVVAVCGSSASWIIQKLLMNKGGLHNRITRRIRLLPFTLKETSDLLIQNNVHLDHYQILHIYMVMGGIPYYLQHIKPGESAAQAVDRMCFTSQGILNQEFGILYHSLFSNADRYLSIIRLLAKRRYGLTRDEIISAGSLSSGGRASQVLDDLLEAGFIARFLPFGRNVKDARFRITDEYTLFYLNFMETNRSFGRGTWLKKSVKPVWRAWSGLAFESICMKHIRQIKTALGLKVVYTEESIWKSKGSSSTKGVQIDLLIDRADQIINVCEIKFSETEFVLSKKYAEELRNKLHGFKIETQTKKSLFLTFITTFRLTENMHKNSLVQNTITMDTLFR